MAGSGEVYKRSDGKSECFYMQPFTSAGKAVFHVEYTDEWNTTSCPNVSKPAGFSSLLKHMDLDAWRKVCP